MPMRAQAERGVSFLRRFVSSSMIASAFRTMCLVACAIPRRSSIAPPSDVRSHIDPKHVSECQPKVVVSCFQRGARGSLTVTDHAERA